MVMAFRFDRIKLHRTASDRLCDSKKRCRQIYIGRLLVDGAEALTVKISLPQHQYYIAVINNLPLI